mgnify:CR=1 FL=1
MNRNRKILEIKYKYIYKKKRNIKKEIIIVDDFSTDNTKRILKKLCFGFSTKIQMKTSF